MASSHERWTPEEDAALRKHADKGPGWDGWGRLLDGRTYHAIVARRKVLGIQFKPNTRTVQKDPVVRTKPKPKPKTKPRNEDIVVVAGQSSWTPEQDEALLKGAVALTEACGHNWQECAMRVCELVATTRAGKEGS